MVPCQPRGSHAEERQSFAAWLRTSPMHVEEYLAHSVIARDLHKACEYSEEASANYWPAPECRLIP